jgi:hypothetical protein
MTRSSSDSQQAKPPKSIARWVAGVVAVFSGAATIYGLFSDKRVAVFAFIGMIIAITLLLVVQRAIRAMSAQNATFYDLLVKALIIFVLLYFMALTAALFPFLYKWLTNSGPSPPVNPVSLSRSPGVNKPGLTEPLPTGMAGLRDACKPGTQDCTVFVFDYLHDQIGGDELQAFQNYQADRLDKGIRNHLQGLDLLKGIDFHVIRCSAATITESSLADRAINILKVPAIMWGFIKKRSDNKLVSTTTITLLDDHLKLGSREELGDDITELLRLTKPITGNPLAIGTLIVGDAHLKAGEIDFARKAFLHARELVADVDDPDQRDFLAAVNNRLQQLETHNPASALRPIAGTDQ